MVLGSGIRDPEKTYSGSRIQGSKSPRSRIRIRNTGWWWCLGAHMCAYNCLLKILNFWVFDKCLKF